MKMPQVQEKKYLDTEGVQRLWNAIEQKFVQGVDLQEILDNLPTGENNMQPLTTAEIDAITGYVEPQNEEG